MGQSELEWQEGGGGGVRKFRRCTLHKAAIKFGIAAKCSSKKERSPEGERYRLEKWKAEGTREERKEKTILNLMVVFCFL